MNEVVGDEAVGPVEDDLGGVGAGADGYWSGGANTKRGEERQNDGDETTEHETNSRLRFARSG